MPHPNQGPKAGHTAPLLDVDVATGINESGAGFVQVLATGATDKRALRLVGQLTPGIARSLGTNLLEAAEAAIGDEALFAVARDVVHHNNDDDVAEDELAKEVLAVAGRFIEAARHQRGRSMANTDTLEVVAEAVDELNDEDTEAE